MSFSSSDTQSLSDLSGNQNDVNLYDPDRAYTQQLLAYEMNGPGAVTGSEYNPFNLGPASMKPDPHGWEHAPGDWQYGNGYLPNSPITPNDTLPPPEGNPQNTWNGHNWQDTPLPPGGGDGGSPDPFGRHTRIVERPVGPNMPVQHEGDPGTSTNPIENPNRHAPGDPNFPEGDPREFGQPAQGPFAPMQRGVPVRSPNGNPSPIGQVIR